MTTEVGAYIECSPLVGHPDPLGRSPDNIWKMDALRMRRQKS
jgi:hypothetical protein